MAPQRLLSEILVPVSIECWDDESTASALRALAVRLHATGLSLRETAAVSVCFDVSRSHQAIWQWVHHHANSVPDLPTAQPSRVAVDETADQIRYGNQYREQRNLHPASPCEGINGSPRNDSCGP